MTTGLSFRAARAKGFTLIELMITVVVIAILAAVALPAFNSQIRKSRRTEARNALLDLSGRAERLYSANNSYLNSTTLQLNPADLGYQQITAFPFTSFGGGYYTVSRAATATTYTFTATAIGVQAADTQCATYTVDNTGKQAAADSAGTDQTPTCWN
jgi:type IV pilus assembly protein PilE